jgi:hypothetical protein
MTDNYGERDEHVNPVQRPDMPRSVVRGGVEPFVPRRHQPPEPSPMRPQDDIGRMSAEAALKQHEVTAEAIEAMGNELRDRINKLNTAMGDCDLVLKEVAETANAIRDRGKHVHAQIDEAMSLAKAIRDACAEFRKKVS